MYPDVVELRNFYQSRLGCLATQYLYLRIREFWPSAKGQSILGVGYATPYLINFLGESECALALMPSNQGVHHWPERMDCLSFLADEELFPLPDASLDKVLSIHALEKTGNVRNLLREVWRVLKPEGNALFVVPNRRGIWARLEQTPFGYGQPYSFLQLSDLLAESMFLPTSRAAALFFPPSSSNLFLRVSGSLEHLGIWLRATSVAGVLIIEAKKQIYAPVDSRKKRDLLGTQMISTS